MRVRKLYNEGGQVASTILQQLGGANRLHAMTGAYNFMNLGNGLSFKIKNQRANYIKITLNSMDLYDVEVGRIRGFTYKVVAEGQGLYSDQLKPFIEKATGMYLTFGRGFANGGMISVNTDDGEVLKYKIDTDEKSIEVDEATKQYLSDIVLVMNKDFRKLNDTYIFWYDEMSDEDIEELEEVFQTSLTKYSDGGNINIDEEYGYDDSRWYVIEDGFMIKGGIRKPAAIKIAEVLAKKNPNKKYSVIWIEDYESDETDERGFYAKGGKVKKKRAKFQDKVDSISERLEGTKVPKRLRKDYGAKYDSDEANEAARRIAGAQLRDMKMARGGGVWGVNVYVLRNWSESKPKRWNRMNMREMPVEEARKFAIPYIKAYGAENVYIGAKRNYSRY